MPSLSRSRHCWSCQNRYSTLKKTIALAIIPFLLTCSQKKRFNIIDIKVPHQVDSRVLVTKSDQIVYSSNINGDYQLYKISNNRAELIYPETKNLFSPFLIRNNIAGLYDNDGDGAYKIASRKIDKYVNLESPLNFILSSGDGSLILFQPKNDSHVYSFDFTRNKKKVIANVRQQFNGACFSQMVASAVISVDDMLIHLDFVTGDTTHLSTELGGKKLNPYIYDDYLFFANNSASEFYGIYRLDLSQEQTRPKLILGNESDLRMPKFDGTSLFFIEINKSEYLLKRYDFENKDVYSITKNGVVYSYDFVGHDSIVLAHSNFYTPRCIRLYSKSRDLLSNWQCDSINLDMSYKILHGNGGPAYAFVPSEKRPLKGVVLFLHPGLHADFSPRWDDIIMSLCANGFLVIAPNFPMSSGYGKSYENSSFEEASVSIEHWREYISSAYNLPICLLASSSGNILMEFAISKNPETISAAVSLFGIGSIYPINPSFPMLFILGENDPVVDFTTRKSELMNLKGLNSEITVISYPKEGHWFRNAKNIRDAQRRIVAHFSEGLH